MGLGMWYDVCIQILLKVQGQTENVQKESVARNAAVPRLRLYLDLSKVTINSGTSKNVTINCDNWKVMVCDTIVKLSCNFPFTR